MSNHQNQKTKEKIKALEEEIHQLREYLFSDCCRQCEYIVKKIEDYQKEIEILNHEYLR